MDRKQSLANKRRSQKRRNKKRARTIRSMRQVNWGGTFLNKLKSRLGLGKSLNLPSEVNRPLLENTPLLQDAAPVDESTYEQNFSLQPLIAPPVSSVRKFNEDKFDKDLRTLLTLHVAFSSEQNFKNFEKIKEFIVNHSNKNIVLSPLILYIKKCLEENAILFKELDDDDLYNKKKKSIDTYKSNLMKYATDIQVDKLFNSILAQLIQYVSEDEYLLSGFIDDKVASENIGTLTFLNIFNDNIFNDSRVVPGIIQESEFLKNHALNIQQDIDLTAGGSKGNMKSKMSRPKSRTRKS